MSYANGTPFLNLAQTVGTDHRDWFDENEAKLDLDTKMKTLWDERTSTATILTALQESVATLDTDVTSLSGIVSGHTSTIATINESLVLINTALNALNTQVVNKFDSVGIADPYDSSYGIYAVGDVVTYNGQRYVCTTAVTAAEPFDVSKWDAEDVQTAIESIASAEFISGDGTQVKAFTTNNEYYDIPSDGLYKLIVNTGAVEPQANSVSIGTSSTSTIEGNLVIASTEVAYSSACTTVALKAGTRLYFHAPLAANRGYVVKY